MSLTCSTCLTAHHLRRFWKNALYPSPSGSEQWAVCSGQFAQPAARCASLPFLPVRVVRVVRGSNLAPPWSLRSPQLCVRYLRFQSSAHCPLHTNHWHGLPGPSPYPFLFIRAHSWFKFCSILASVFSAALREIITPSTPGTGKPSPYSPVPITVLRPSANSATACRHDKLCTKSCVLYSRHDL